MGVQSVSPPRAARDALISSRAVVYEWNWLSLPYLACAVALVAVALVAALTRGDRVLRLGTIGAATTALPWALCSGLAMWFDDPVTVERLLRLGNGPVALVGPSLLLVLLGVSGQLERHRWLARIAAVIGAAFLGVCWGTDWVVSGVHRLSSGILYIDPGPLTPFHYLQIGLWLGVGMAVMRRSTTGGERRRMQRMLVGVLALGTVGASDLLLVYDIAGAYPIAWLCTLVAALVTLWFELKTNLLRPQGFDRAVFIELLGLLITVTIVGAIAVTLDDISPVVLAAIASTVWIAALAISWAMLREEPVRIARQRALEELVAALADVDGAPAIGALLAALWRQVGIEVRALYG
ncbi:MAG: hypothetical protein M3680_21345, partial [Myxococcota bacterium]|nr:hypothetical protein [Myxococcota bacterium]